VALERAGFEVIRTKGSHHFLRQARLSRTQFLDLL
jgi:predicted RNA binding protein YcfA (HicA-like mRNA interferase family)